MGWRLEGDSVGVVVVGKADGLTVGVVVGASVGLAVGASDGLEVGLLVGLRVGIVVGATVGQLLHIPRHTVAIVGSAQSVTPGNPHSGTSSGKPAQLGRMSGAEVGDVDTGALVGQLLHNAGQRSRKAELLTHVELPS